MTEHDLPKRRASVFEWDENKRRLNVIKHGIDFDDAKDAFFDPAGFTVLSPAPTGEIRYVTVGLMRGTLVAVISTPRGAAIRIISARAARRNERRLYGTQSKEKTRR